MRSTEGVFVVELRIPDAITPFPGGADVTAAASIAEVYGFFNGYGDVTSFGRGGCFR